MDRTLPIKEAAVYIARLDDYSPAGTDAAIDRLLEALGGLGRFVRAGQVVLIKPNLISPVPLSQTNKQVIVGIARKVRQAGARPMIADSPAWGSVRGAAGRSGLAGLADAEGIEIRSFSRPCRVRAGIGSVCRHLTVDRLALEADVIINVPKLKSHSQMTLTAGVKNMFGCVPGKRKAWWHQRVRDRKDHFAEMLLEVYRLLQPALTIIDGVEAMEGGGPIHGRPRAVGALVGSADAVAAETVCCRMLKVDVADVPVMRAAERLGIGQCRLDQIVLTGEPLSNVQVEQFDLGRLAPIGFSLPRVVRSVVRQLWLLGLERLQKAGSR